MEIPTLLVKAKLPRGISISGRWPVSNLQFLFLFNKCSSLRDHP